MCRSFASLGIYSVRLRPAQYGQHLVCETKTNHHVFLFWFSWLFKSRLGTNRDVLALQISCGKTRCGVCCLFIPARFCVCHFSICQQRGQKAQVGAVHNRPLLNRSDSPRRVLLRQMSPKKKKTAALSQRHRTLWSSVCGEVFLFFFRSL